MDCLIPVQGRRELSRLLEDRCDRAPQEWSVQTGRLTLKAHGSDQDPTHWRWFTTVDTDGSGHISPKELQQALINGDHSKFESGKLSSHRDDYLC